MADLVIDLPVDNEFHWGPKLVAAIDQIVGRVNEISVGQESSEPLLLAHLADETPHPVYDDIPSLVLVFENGLI